MRSITDHLRTAESLLAWIVFVLFLVVLIRSAKLSLSLKQLLAVTH